MTADVIRLPVTVKPAPELERLLIGGLLELSDTLKMISGSGLTSLDFQDLRFRQAWDVARVLARMKQPVNAGTVWAAGRSQFMFQDRDAAELSALEAGNTLDEAGFFVVAEALWRLIRAKEVAAHLRVTAGDLEQGRFITSEIPRRLVDISQQFDRTFSSDQSAAAEVVRFFERMNERDEGKIKKDDRMPTRIELIDKEMGGWPSDFCGLLGQPGEGKSAVMGGMMAAQLEADPDLRLGYFPLEGGVLGLIKRMTARDSGLSLRQLGEKRSREDADKVNALGERLYKLFDRVLWFDWSRGTAAEICQRARQWKRKFGIGAVYLDTLSKVEHRGRAGNFKDQQNKMVAESVYAFGDFARTEDVPFVAAIHTSRPEGEKKVERPPMLKEAAESADIDRELRAAWGCWLKKGEMRATFLKMNEEKLGATVEFERVANAAIILPTGGSFIDLRREEAEERRDKKLDARLEGAALTDEVKSRRAKREAQAEPKKPDEPAPQLALLDVPAGEKPGA